MIRSFGMVIACGVLIANHAVAENTLTPLPSPAERP